MKKIAAVFISLLVVLSLFSGIASAAENSSSAKRNTSAAKEPVSAAKENSSAAVRAASSETVEENGLRYQIIDDENATVVGLTGDVVDLVIPSKVRNIPVTAISSDAFCKNQTLQSIVLPETIVTIEDGEAVFIEDTMSYDEIGAFSQCTSLTSVIIPESSSLQHIGKYAFAQDSSLASISLPSSLREIAECGFSDTSSLESIVLPEGLESVGQNAFSSSGLKSLHIPASLTSFHPWNHMRELQEITVEEGNEFYQSIDGVLYYEWPDDGWNLFIYPWAKEAEEYIVPDFIEELDTDSLGPLRINNVWTNPKYLKQIKLSDDQYLMEGFIIGPTISVNESHPKYTVIDGVIYDKEVQTLIAIPASLTGDIVIQDGVTEIADWAGIFTHFTSVTIPASVKTIGHDVFSENYDVETVRFLGSIDTMGVGFLSLCSSIKNIAFPKGLTEIPGYTLYCAYMDKIFIPSSVKTIGDEALGINIGDIYFEGTEAEWANVSIPEDSAVRWARIHYNVEHVYVQEVITKESTYTEEGTVEKTCMICGQTITETIPKLKPSPGWNKINGVWYYASASGEFVTGWQRVGNAWYYLDPDKQGAMAVGRIKVKNAFYYMDQSGVMRTGWIDDNGTWYYAQSSGALAVGWVKVGTVWYYMDASGAMQTGWLTINGSKYYMTASGAMATGWVKDGDTWYYMNSSGAMVTGWVKVGSTWYYMKANGAMAVSEWVTGYYWISASGAWTYQPVGSWKQNSTGWWFGDTSGWYAKNETLKINDVLYTFNAAGYWVK